MAKVYKFITDGNKKVLKESPTTLLSQIRDKLKLDDNHFFLNGDIPIDHEAEEQTSIQAIETNNEIQIRTIKKET